jgi:pilus assembly protein CpaB
VRFLTPALLTIVLLLVVGGLVVAYVVKNVFAAEEVVVDERRNYPMAVAELEPGAVITEAHLAQGPWPSSEEKPTFARSTNILIGRVVKHPINAARPIDTLDLYPPGQFPPLEIADGMRAVSIEVGDGAAVVDGLVQEKGYVDVHFTPNVDGDSRFRGGFTMTMFEGVKVLAVNRMGVSNMTGRGSNTVTLELTPEQANIILLAQDKGRINMTYTPEGPGNGGVAVADEDKAFFEEILGLAPAAEEKPLATEIYYGGGRQVMTFNKDGSPLSTTGDAWNNGDGGRTPPNQSNGFEPTRPLIDRSADARQNTNPTRTANYNRAGIRTGAGFQTFNPAARADLRGNGI